MSAGTYEQTVLPFTGLEVPQGVAVSASGDVYVSDLVTNTVTMLHGGTQVPMPFDGLDQPFGIALGPDATLYVADTLNNRVMALHDVTAAPVAVPLTVIGPFAVAVSEHGDLYVGTPNKVLAWNAATHAQSFLPFTDVQSVGGVRSTTREPCTPRIRTTIAFCGWPPVRTSRRFSRSPGWTSRRVSPCPAEATSTSRTPTTAEWSCSRREADRSPSGLARQIEAEGFRDGLVHPAVVIGEQLFTLVRGEPTPDAVRFTDTERVLPALHQHGASAADHLGAEVPHLAGPATFAVGWKNVDDS